MQDKNKFQEIGPCQGKITFFIIRNFAFGTANFSTRIRVQLQRVEFDVMGEAEKRYYPMIFNGLGESKHGFR